MTLKRGQNVKYLPYAFTEHGALQAANILNSPRAVQMSVFVIRAFVKMRDELAANSAMVKRLAQIDSTLFLHDSALRDLYQKLRPLLAPPPEPPPKPRIGFHAVPTRYINNVEESSTSREKLSADRLSESREPERGDRQPYTFIQAAAWNAKQFGRRRA